MDFNNQFQVVIINIYLLLIYLLIYYKNKFIKNKHKLDPIDLKKINKTLIIYIYNKNRLRELFNVTILDLIERKYFKLTQKDGKTYISKSDKELDNSLKHDQEVYNYLNTIIDEKIELKDLDLKIKTDLSLTQTLTKYYKSVKEESRNLIGKLDFISDYGLASILGIPYFMIIVYSIHNSFLLYQNFLIALVLMIMTIIISDKVRDSRITKKSFILFSIIAYISSYIWIQNSTFNYIIFHVIIGGLSFLYPVFMRLVKYSVNTNTFYFNLQQSRINEEINTKENYKDNILNFALNNNYIGKNKGLTEFFNTFK